MNTEKKRWHQAKHEAKIQEWREILWECRHSGQGVGQWCKEHGINEKTYYGWQQQVWEAEIEKKSIETENSTEIQFVEVPNINHEPEMRKTGIIIQKGGWRIEIERDANPEMVIRVIQTVARYV